MAGPINHPRAAVESASWSQSLERVLDGSLQLILEFRRKFGMLSSPFSVIIVGIASGLLRETHKPKPHYKLSAEKECQME